MPDATGPVTLLDVARRAGVSMATASRVLNGGTRQVRPDLRDRVVAAAKALNYSPNAQAQAVARGRTNAIGLVVSDIVDPYFSSIAAGVMRTAEEHGLVVTIGSTMQRPERELNYLAALRGQRARAAILVGSRFDDPTLLNDLAQEIEAFERLGGRTALISQYKLPADTIMVENRVGARDLAVALAGLGHRSFVVLGGPPGLLTARDRILGFREGLASCGIELPDEQIVPGPFNRDGGYAAMQEALARGLHTTCTFAVNDVMAVGAMAALRDHGIPLPDRMAVAGFDDVVSLRDIVPSLTTVRLPLERLGEMAMELVLEPKAEKPRVRVVGGEIVLRESTPHRH